jgi:hypothetical protein
VNIIHRIGKASFNAFEGVFITSSFFILLFVCGVLSPLPSISGGPLGLTDEDVPYREELTLLKSQADQLPVGSKERHAKLDEWKALLMKKNKEFEQIIKEKGAELKMTPNRFIKYNKWIIWSWFFYALAIVYLLRRIEKGNNVVYASIIVIPALGVIYSLFV